LKSLAEAFNLSAETILEQAGLVDDSPGDERESVDTEAAIRTDPRLTAAQKEALLAVYRGFTNDRDAGD
jgi:hypothetical protein